MYSPGWLALLLLCSTACREAEDTFAIEAGAIAVTSTDPDVQAASAALAQGRPWRATQLIIPALRDSTRRTPEVVMLAATAASEWGGWEEVERLLTSQPWLDGAFEGRGRALLARAALNRGADSLAAAHARGATDAAGSERDRGVAMVLLARAFDRMDRRDSAQVIYAKAAALLPRAADWLHLRAAGVTADNAQRAAYYSRLSTVAARDRVPRAEAVARERTGDLAGAAAAFAALGERASALRLQLTATTDSAMHAPIRQQLVELIGSTSGSLEARTAAEVLDAFVPRLTAAEELEIARSTARSGPVSRAATGFARAFEQGLGTSRDRFSYGTILMQLNRDREAAAQFARVTEPRALAADAAYQRGRALLRSGQGDAARTQLRAVVRLYADEPNAAGIALLLLGDLATDEGRDGPAREAFLDVVKRFPGSASAPNAAFRAATIAFVTGQYRAAARELDALRRDYPRSTEVHAAGYWSGRAWAHAGDTAAARERWRAVMAAEPMSYYAMLSARRLGATPWAPPAAADSFPKFGAVDSAVARARLLEQLGMDFEARLEYDRLDADALQSPDRALATAHAFREQQLSSRAIALMRRAMGGGIPRDARTYRLLYPVTHSPVLSAESAERGLDPALVSALIRQESHFNPRATSQAGARGLMQLMPSVGRSIAQAEGFPVWDPVLLYMPEVNIRLGTNHLASLSRTYAEEAHILAAYNAGGSRVARWRNKRGTDDAEVFIERIPFVETRDYVRIVIRNRALYEALYDWSELRPANGEGGEQG